MHTNIHSIDFHIRALVYTLITLIEHLEPIPRYEYTNFRHLNRFGFTDTK